MNEQLKIKKSWLDYLFYKIGRQNYDFELCSLKKMPDGSTVSSEWKKYSQCIFLVDFNGSSDDKEAEKFFAQINQRQILPNEIVLDYDTEQPLTSLVKKLQTMKLLFHIFETGSRGYHVHIFFNRPFTREEKLKIIRYFQSDEQKSIDRTMISLEFIPHWKSGKIKERLVDGVERWVENVA
ncbi:hypothetical protein HYV50_04650 [Candidatus Pacearchaeota archaeon]|nr:hypothetical protein [Candidatus Pacearchaeota archaeon]